MGDGKQLAPPTAEEAAPVDDRALAQLPRNDIGNALRFIARFGSIVRETPGHGVRVYENGRWVLDDPRKLTKVRALAQRTIAAMSDREGPDDSDHRRFAHRCSTTRAISALIREALVHLQQDASSWDSDPALLNLPNGTLELSQTRITLRPHAATDYITLIGGADYDRDAECPNFLRALETWQPDRKTRAYIQRCVGACLGHAALSQVMIFMHGTGGNGKSAFMEAICGVLNEYAVQVDPAVFQRFRNAKPGPNPTLVRLNGRRLIRATEPDEGAPLSESLIKQITGGEPFEARGLYAAPQEYRLKGRIFMSCNKMPKIKGTDKGIWRRIIVIPWLASVAPAQGEEPIDEILARERSGILNWMIEGWREHTYKGVGAFAEEVLVATKDYRAQSDVIGLFVSECCMLDPKAKEHAADLYSAYQQWTAGKSFPQLTSHSFAQQLGKRGFPRGGAARAYRLKLMLKPHLRPLATPR